MNECRILFGCCLIFGAGCASSPEQAYHEPPSFIEGATAFLGKNALSCASLDLYYYDAYACYPLGEGASSLWDNQRACIRYLEYLYRRAFERELSKLTSARREVLEFDEYEWRCWQPVFGLNTPKPKWICADREEQIIRFVRNRAFYWECHPERRALLTKMNRLPVFYKGGFVDMQYGEVVRERPVDMNDRAKGTFRESVAFLLPDFCREATVGRDDYQIGLLLPTNDVSGEPASVGRERNLCIWKNGEPHAVHQLPLECTVLSVETHGREVTVKFVQWDTGEIRPGIDWRARKARTLTLDFTLAAYGGICITNWYDQFRP